MLKSVRLSQIYVLDQDEALDFYVGKLGLEVNTDADLGFMRWLTVSVPGEPDREILLESPARRRIDDATAEQVRELVSKGATAAGSASPPTTSARPTRTCGQGRGVHPGACRAVLRHRRRAARPVRQRDPHPPAALGALHFMGSEDCAASEPT
jgi:catechol 2,3-dioxygenase-like lactoylglutathione lyase family enzyme